MSGCDGKIPHATMELAHREAERMSAETGEALEGYECRSCEAFHVGHTRFANPVEGNMGNPSNYDHATFEERTAEGQVQETPAPDIGTLAVLNKSEIYQQIETARRFPRQISKFRKEALELATLDERTAAECIYALPRDGKTIEGPSARFAEIINYAWGNTRAGARVISEGEEFVTSQGIFYDLEKNTAISYEVQRRIVDKNGRRFKLDMIGTTSNAASSIALRNAVLKGIPKALWNSIYLSARKVVAGDSTTLVARRDEAIKAFVIHGIKPEQIFATLGVGGIQDITIDHLVALKGILTAIQEGDTTPEQAFAKPDGSHVRAANGSQSTVDTLREKYASGGAGSTPDPSLGQAPQTPASTSSETPREPAPSPSQTNQTEQFDPQQAVEKIVEHNRSLHGPRRGTHDSQNESQGVRVDFTK